MFSVPKCFVSSLSSEGISAFYVDGKKKQLPTSWGDYSHKHNEVEQEDIVALGISYRNIEEIVDYTQRKYDEKYFFLYLTLLESILFNYLYPLRKFFEMCTLLTFQIFS